MIDQLKERLTALQEEYVHGEQQIMELDASREELQSRLLRISGAIQVLEEELGKCNEAMNASEGAAVKAV